MLIQSLFSQTKKPKEIIVVVDEKPQTDFPFVKFVVNEGVGLSAARNTGMKHAVGDIIAFIDDDAVADPKWIEGLLGCFIHGADVAGGTVLPYYEDTQTISPQLNWLLGCTVANKSRPIGCNFAVRHDIGLKFDERLGKVNGMGGIGEDTDLVNRAMLYGKNVCFEPHAIVWHRIPDSRLKLSYLARRAYNEGLYKARVGIGEMEHHYASRYLHSYSLLPWFILCITGVGYIVGRIGGFKQ
jgi:glycosyltransferase involved in cell wall biosynthesis